MKIMACILASGMLEASLQHEPIKLYAMYTPSHEVFLKGWFNPRAHDNYEVILERVEEQICPTGSFMSRGWREVMIKKIDLVIRAIRENPDSYFVHSDVDVQYLRSSSGIIRRLMKDYDLLIQRDDPSGSLCAGFFVCRGNKKTLRLFSRIKDELILIEKRLKDAQLSQEEKKILAKIHDQGLLNQLIRASNPYHIKWSYLPSSFFGAGTLEGRIWGPGQPLIVPKDIVVHHANWTRGVFNKIKQLAYVRTYFEEHLRSKKIISNKVPQAS